MNDLLMHVGFIFLSFGYIIQFFAFFFCEAKVNLLPSPTPNTTLLNLIFEHKTRHFMREIFGRELGSLRQETTVIQFLQYRKLQRCISAGHEITVLQFR